MSVTPERIPILAKVEDGNTSDKTWNLAFTKKMRETLDDYDRSKQYKEFDELLVVHGVEVIKLPSSRNFPERVFTRDIGFTVGEDIFGAEKEELEDWLEDEDIAF